MATSNCNSNISLTGRRENNLESYLSFKLYTDTEDSYTETDVFVGGVYSITWYDSVNQTMQTNKYIHVTNINASRIVGSYVVDNYPGECLCVHREDLYDYVTTKSVLIPVSNIYSITHINVQQTEKCKEVTKVSVLGISSDFIRSVIIRLRIYSDDADTDITTVDMEVGKRYNIQYFDHNDHTMYEIEGKLTNIAIDRHFGDEPPQTGFVRPECPCPEEVGIGNSIYYTQDHFMELPKDCPEKVVFIFDTSTINHSTYDHVRLTDIRDVYEVKSEDGSDNNDSDNSSTNGENSGNSYCCDNCPYKDSSTIVPPIEFPPMDDGDDSITNFPLPPLNYPVNRPPMAPPPPYDPAFDKLKAEIPINDSTVAQLDIINGVYIFKDTEGNIISSATIEEIIKNYLEP